MNPQLFAPMIATVMLTLGLSLSVDDFRRVAQIPKPIGVALFCQILILPTICFLLARLFALPPVMAVGLMLMAAAPGGTLANIISHLADGDLALNLTLTALNAVLAIVTLPLTVALSMAYFLDQAQAIPLQYGKALQVFVVMFVPIAIGMFLRHRYPRAALRLQPAAKLLAATAVLAIAIPAVISQWPMMQSHFAMLSGAVITLCLLSLTVGYLVPRLMQLNDRQAIAISLEIGVHNGALAITVASSPQLLNNQEMAVPAIFYGVLMPVLAGSFILVVRGLKRYRAAAV